MILKSFCEPFLPFVNGQDFKSFSKSWCHPKREQSKSIFLQFTYLLRFKSLHQHGFERQHVTLQSSMS